MKTYATHLGTNLFLNFDASKFNAENGINASMTFWNCPVEDVECFAGMEPDYEVYNVGMVASVKIMQGKTRSGIKVKFIHDSGKGYTIGAWKNIKELSKESGQKVLDAIVKKLNN